MTVLVAADFTPGEWAAWWPALQAAFQAALPGERLVRARSGAPSGEPAAMPTDTIDVALVANPPPGALRGLPGLRLVQSLWAGVDGLLADASVPTDVPLARMVDPWMYEAMAQTALWAVIALHRGFFGYAGQQQRAEWCQHPQRRADEVGVAVLGLGRMGRAAAQRLARNGYCVTGWSRHAQALDGVATRAGPAALAQVLAAAQIVVNLLPLTPATRGLFNEKAFAAMPRGASLVNLGRGAHVVEADLLAALDSGQLGHAVLDVFHTEPLPAAHPFWPHPKISVLPHIAAQTDPRSAACIAAANVLALREGRPPENVVDRTRGY